MEFSNYLRLRPLRSSRLSEWAGEILLFVRFVSRTTDIRLRECLLFAKRTGDIYLFFDRSNECMFFFPFDAVVRVAFMFSFNPLPIDGEFDVLKVYCSTRVSGVYAGSMLKGGHFQEFLVLHCRQYR